MAEAKIHPPSPSRIAEARAAGHAPSPLLAGMAGGICALALASRELLPRVRYAWTRLAQAPLEALAQGDLARAEQLARAHAAELADGLSWLALLLIACVLLALVAAQGVVFVWPRRARRPFTRAKASYLAPALFVLGLAILLLVSLHAALWLTSAEVGAFVSRYVVHMAALVLGVWLVDAAVARERFFRSLWLTRREQREELREAFGAPETREARAGARQAQRGEDAA